MEMVVRKNPILGIALTILTQLYHHRETRSTYILELFRSHFVNAIPRFHYDTKSAVWNIFAICLKSNIQFFFIQVLISVLFFVKSNSHKVHVLLILCFYLNRCHRNIDSPKNQIVTNFSLRPVTGVNFTSIRVWKAAKQPNEKLGMARKKLYWTTFRWLVMVKTLPSYALYCNYNNNAKE